MNHDFKTCTFNLRSGSREIEVNQLLLYVVEVNKDMEDATGVDLISAATAGIDSLGAAKIAHSLGLSAERISNHSITRII